MNRGISPTRRHGAELLAMTTAFLLLVSRSPAEPEFEAGVDRNTSAAPVPAVLQSLLVESWEAYKKRFIQADGRVIDFGNNGVSTSEGQAYAMLRAVWMDDFGTFRRTFDWAERNLNAGVRTDHLHGWKWGPRDDGSWGVYDRTSATDADELIAFALIEAEARWPNVDYHEHIVSLLEDIWSRQTRAIAGRRYVLGGDWPKSDAPVRVNPSYYMPFVYRSFSRIDSARPWTNAIDVSYEVFTTCRSAVGLPVNWCLLDQESPRLTVSRELTDRSSDFGYDAFRVLWNLAFDYVTNHEPRAMEAMAATEWLRRYWVLRRELPALVSADGIPLVSHDYTGMYAAYLPALSLIDPPEAARMFRTKLLAHYHDGVWGNPTDYYAQNWCWFGVYLYDKILRTGIARLDKTHP